MKNIDRIRNDTDDYLIDHPMARQWLKWIGMFFLTVISGFVFAYGFRAFINPSQGCISHWEQQAIDAGENFTRTGTLISGGASGTSQSIIRLILIFFNVSEYETLLISIFYFLVNLPLIILAWCKISKQFTVFTLINVAIASIFQTAIPDAWIYNVVNIYDNLLARCIFGGICTGISSGLAMMIGTSAGGADIICLYMAEKKKSPVGRFTLKVNSAIVISFVIFSIIGHVVHPEYNTIEPGKVVTNALYTFIYVYVTSHVVDFINIRNLKVELQIVTTKEEMSQILVRAFPHAATIMEGTGAFTGEKRYIINTVISRAEKAKVVEMVNKVDPHSFVSTLKIEQVYGRFYTNPIE